MLLITSPNGFLLLAVARRRTISAQIIAYKELVSLSRSGSVDMSMTIRSDVTIFQRSPVYIMTSAAKNAMTAGVYHENGPPLEVADCLNASFPNLFMAGEFGRRMTAALAKMDKSVNLVIGVSEFTTTLFQGNTRRTRPRWLPTQPRNR